ncbi:MAG: IspD/TarI family cytidylyltransferase [Bacillales bacterium]|nr:IspD/TarI family cytidylyltransferase [Bacillales bacterium]
MNRVLILAGGIGERCSGNLPKQFLKLSGKDIILHTVEKFENSKDIDEIYIACKSDWIDYCINLMNKNEITKFKTCIANGATCLGSILNGLNYLRKISSDSDILLIHDSVRPFIDEEFIHDLIVVAEEKDTCIPICKQIETPITIENDKIKESQNRNSAYVAKAPQVFRFGLIYDCYMKKQKSLDDFCDSAQVALANGVKLNYINGSDQNIKITTRKDFYLARALLNLQEDSQFLK